MINFNEEIMKKILLVAFLMISFGTMAQNNAQATQKARENAKAKLDAARIALITERLDLTPEQAQAFWPLYNEYAEERRQVQRQFREQRQEMDLENLTEEQQKQLLRQRMEQKQKQLNLENKYGERLLNVINARQMMALKKAEDDFRTMILRRIEQRQRQQLQQQMLLQQRERKLRQGNN
jgi:hypothetical protein